MNSNSGYTFSREKSLIRIKEIEEALKTGGKTSNDLMLVIGLTRARICQFLKHLKKIDRAYVSHWQVNSCGYTPVWVLGVSENAKKPQIRTKSRKEAERKLQRAKFLEKARGFKPQPVSRHPFDVMFYGPAYVGLNAELRGMV